MFVRSPITVLYKRLDYNKDRYEEFLKKLCFYIYQYFEKSNLHNFEVCLIFIVSN